MSSDQSKALVRFVIGASRMSLGDFYLAKLNRSANLERELREKLHALVEERALVLFANLLREHGEEIVAELAPRRRSRARGG
jgi:hypothetical protein